MPNTSTIPGLQLNKSERVVLLLLSYLFYGPLLWKTSARFINNAIDTIAEARRQLREEDAEQPRGHQQQEG